MVITGGTSPGRTTMTKANDLVLDGGEVKLRLQADRIRSGTMVHVDWLRFTCILRNVVPTFKPLADDLALMPHPFSSTFGDMPKRVQEEKIHALLKAFAVDDPDSKEFPVMCQALELAKEVCDALGPDFAVCGEVKKGHDFYKYRWPLERNGFECGWVGFLASSDSPRQQSQALTLHVNLFGHAMTFAQPGARELLADIVEIHEAKITRCDLALDFFNGMSRSLPELLEDYKAGAFDVRSKRPGSKIAGDWGNDAERSLYVGCRKSGKETNIYEKGDQLFGRDARNPWVRVELRYGNKLRILPVEILRRPGDFFAGASDWHAAQLLEAGAVVSAQACPQEKQLPLETVTAEVSRNLRWAFSSAAPTLAAAFKYLQDEAFFELVNWETKKLPGRLRRFKEADLSSAFKNVLSHFSPVGGLSPSLA